MSWKAVFGSQRYINSRPHFPVGWVSLVGPMGVDAEACRAYVVGAMGVEDEDAMTVQDHEL